MKVGDLVQRGDVVGLIVAVKYANEIQWIKILGSDGYVGGSNRYFSQIGWKVLNESR
tara:strand:- start:95 stop:265 length:171 start_codon:yes stop_codon:yes gene_type:complete